MHAYLILAHNEPEVLKRLVRSLDYPTNDIYIHWDKKSGPVPVISTSVSRIIFISERVDVRWADYSMVEAELALFSEAFLRGPYEYYHLLSGVDLPIKSQKYIHETCSRNAGVEYIGFAKPTEKEIYWRTQHRFIFTGSLRNGPIWKNAIRKSFLILQDLVRYKRSDCEFRKGPQWVSVTNDFVAYIIERKEWIFTTFNHTFCPDEMFIPTLCWNSPFRSKVFCFDDEFRSCKRYIKWVDGELLPLDHGDLEIMRDSEFWFARKFSSKDLALLDLVKELDNG